MIYLPQHAVGQLLLTITIWVHLGFSKIEATIPRRGKRQASVNADQPHKRPRKELTLHDHCGGKL